MINGNVLHHINIIYICTLALSLHIIKYFCRYDLWLNINEMLTFMVDCWKENVALQYDPKTRSTSNAAGGCVSVPGSG